MVQQYALFGWVDVHCEFNEDFCHVGSEGELEWEVKEILDSTLEQGKLLYIVDWMGYGLESRTWEPTEHVTNSRDTIADYH